MARKPYHLTGEPKDSVFTNILRKGSALGIIPNRIKESRDWYRRQAAGVRAPDTTEMMRADPGRFRQSVQIGRMYMFYYDPKTKADLKYFDRVPLVIPIEMYKDGFLGLNLHYLPPTYRAKLMDGLYQLVNNPRFDETTKMQLSYRLLKGVAKLRYFKPCVKRYLKGYVRSRFVNIAATEWDIALFLPFEQFEKATARTVWEDSKRQIRLNK